MNRLRIVLTSSVLTTFVVLILCCFSSLLWFGAPFHATATRYENTLLDNFKSIPLIPARSLFSLEFARIISFGLYGNDSKYAQGLIQNVLMAPTVYPDWIVRVYHDNTVPDAVLLDLQELGVDLKDVTGEFQGSSSGMFWRFLVADDKSVERFIVRDADSRLNTREAAAVDEWIQSNKSCHVMRDHPSHFRPILGGMWGCKGGVLPNIRVWINNSVRELYGADMDMLEQVVWPAIQEQHLAHDSFFCATYPGSVSFPTRRPADFQHVGQVFENYRPRVSDVTCCKREAPAVCRRNMSWIYG